MHADMDESPTRCLPATVPLKSPISKQQSKVWQNCSLFRNECKDNYCNTYDHIVVDVIAPQLNSEVEVLGMNGMSLAVMQAIPCLCQQPI